MRRTIFSQKLNNKWQKIVHSDVRQSTTKKILATIAAIFCAFAIAIIIACSVCKTWGKFGEVISDIFTLGFQTKYINTLFSNMAILIVGGLAFVFAYKAGLFNIGISGQMVAGATVATLICHLWKLPAGFNQVFIIIISMAIGALVAGIVGTLKAYLRVNEVVSSIMFNWIIYFMSILILGSIKTIPHDASNLNTNAPADNLLLRIGGESWIPLVIIAGLLIIIVAVIINYTVFGRKQRVTGLSNSGALAAGYNVKANMIASMAISGAISGILGVMLYCGFSPNMPITAAAKAIPQEGFNGISVGLISMCSPVASIPVSLFFSMIKTSVSGLQMIGIDNHIADVVFGIVVYGAAAIALFLNLKPYWLTLEVFKGKNYSKIRHERNMTNIELLSLAGDQCAILKKYFVYYQKTTNVKSTLKLSPAIRFNMWIADKRYHFTLKRSQRRVKRNTKMCAFSYQQYLKQEMVHIVARNGILVADLENKKFGGWYVKVNDQMLRNPQLKARLEESTQAKCNSTLIKQLHVANEQFKAKPFNSRQLRLVPKLSYLQNLRTGLIYRDQISKENKLAYFTFMQTKNQAEAIGLSEIRSKQQYEFARTAYFKAYQKTFDVVKNHYDAMVRNFGKGKQFNAFGVRFNQQTLAELYIRNLKEEIAEIAHLINCPMNNAQLHEVNGLVIRERFLNWRIEGNTDEAEKIRKEARKHALNCANLTKKVSKYKFESTLNTRKIASLSQGSKPLSNYQLDDIAKLTEQSYKLNRLIKEDQEEAARENYESKACINKTKDINAAIVKDKFATRDINQRLASIAAAARKAEASSNRGQADKIKENNIKVQEELDRIAKKQEKRELKELKAIKLAKIKARKEREKAEKKKAIEKIKYKKLAILATYKKEQAESRSIQKDEAYEVHLQRAQENKKQRAEARKQRKENRQLRAQQKQEQKQIEKGGK